MQEKIFGIKNIILSGFAISVLMTLVLGIGEYIVFKAQIESFGGLVIPTVAVYLVLIASVIFLSRKTHINSREMRITMISANSFYMLLAFGVMAIIYLVNVLNAGLEYIGVVALFLISETISLVLDVILLIMMGIRRTKV